ncbi:malate/lactate/ureidoglycolate dehydrogenase, partial [Raoultella planticola]
AHAPILVPGEWEEANRQARLAQGIPLDASSWQAICQAALEAGFPPQKLAQFQPKMG